MPVERVKSRRQRTAQLAPSDVSDCVDNFVLVRLENGADVWCTWRDLWYLEPGYKIIGHARRV